MFAQLLVPLLPQVPGYPLSPKLVLSENRLPPSGSIVVFPLAIAIFGGIPFLDIQIFHNDDPFPSNETVTPPPALPIQDLPPRQKKGARWGWIHCSTWIKYVIYNSVPQWSGVFYLHPKKNIPKKGQCPKVAAELDHHPQVPRSPIPPSDPPCRPCWPRPPSPAAAPALRWPQSWWDRWRCSGCRCHISECLRHGARRGDGRPMDCLKNGRFDSWLLGYCCVDSCFLEFGR